jgi:aspartate 1-decarboxylase
MMNLMVKSKIHRATVTDGNLAYKGSITVDRKLMKAANLRPFEFVHVNNLSNAVHWETYVIPGDDGQIVLNGPPARLFQKGDKVVILGFSYLTNEEMSTFEHVDVMVTDTNEITDVIVSKSDFE